MGLKISIVWMKTPVGTNDGSVTLLASDPRMVSSEKRRTLPVSTKVVSVSRVGGLLPCGTAQIKAMPSSSTSDPAPTPSHNGNGA